MKKKTGAETGALQYVGQEFLVGVPARNLTPEEASLYADLIAENEQATGRPLYVAMTEAAEQPATTEGGGNG